MTTTSLLVLLSLLVLIGAALFLFLAYKSCPIKPTQSDKICLSLAATTAALYALWLAPSILWREYHLPPPPATEGPNPPMAPNGIPQDPRYTQDLTDAQQLTRDRSRVTDIAGIRAN